MMEKFLKVRNKLLSDRKIFVKDSDEIVKLNLIEVILYCKMYERYHFFKEMGNEFYDNQKDLAESLGVSRQTIITALDTLVSAKAISVKTTTIKGFHTKNVYTVYDVFISEEDRTKSKLQKVVNKPKPRVVEIDDDPDWVSPY